MNFDLFILIGAILIFVSIVVGKTSSRFGVPVLLLFLLVGFVFGSDGLNIISFNSPATAQNIGVIALCIILFSGGMDTNIDEIRPVVGPGLVLATAGVLLTALITGLFVFALTNLLGFSTAFGFGTSLLLASIMSSTDSASVFSILRNQNLSLKENLRPLLELESGSNDPMAYLLTITMIQALTGDVSGGFILRTFLMQLLLGAVCGALLGKGTVRLINRINLENDAIYSVLLLTLMFFIYGLTGFIGGNGFLAVYTAGLLIGNHRFVHKRSTVRFYEGITWLAQIVMFLSLGLLVNPSELIPVAGIGLVVGLFLIFAARPAAVFLCLLPFRQFSTKSRLFASFVGLRGAAPILFATYPMIHHVPQAQTLFNIVFFITLLSLLVQGTLVGTVARWLKLGVTEAPKQKLKEFDVDMSDDIKSTMSEVKVTPRMLQNGPRLMDIDLPDHCLIAMVKRNGKYFIPRGNTALQIGDALLMLTDTEEAMQQIHATFEQ